MTTPPIRVLCIDDHALVREGIAALVNRQADMQVVAVAAHLTDEPLTRREIEVLTVVATGAHNKEIAATLGISEETVKMHIKSIMAKLGAEDRTGAVTTAIKRGVIHL